MNLTNPYKELKDKLTYMVLSTEGKVKKDFVKKLELIEEKERLFNTINELKSKWKQYEALKEVYKEARDFLFEIRDIKQQAYYECYPKKRK